MPVYHVNNPTRKELLESLQIIDETGEIPQSIVTAVTLPSGASEIAMSHDFLTDKIKYILSAYNEDMHLNTNDKIKMTNVMIVWREPYKEPINEHT